MRDLTQLGFRRYGSLPFPPFSDETLRAFEAAFGVTLPDDYVHFLRFYNGGTLAVTHYDDPATGGLGGINDFYGLGSREVDEKAAAAGKWEYGNLWGETRIFRTHLLPGRGVPFAQDGGSNRLYLDFSEMGAPVNRLIVATKKSYRLAPDFGTFVDMLHEDRGTSRGQRARKMRAGGLERERE